MLPKLYQGDDRTPEGIYEINELLSMDAGKDSESYRKLLNMNKVFLKNQTAIINTGILRWTLEIMLMVRDISD